MKWWARELSGARCGRCRAQINRGEPALFIKLVEAGVVRARCRTCAGEPVPELPELVERAAVPIVPMAHIRTGAGALPFDFKTAAAGGRDPGEEG